MAARRETTFDFACLAGYERHRGEDASADLPGDPVIGSYPPVFVASRTWYHNIKESYAGSRDLLWDHGGVALKSMKFLVGLRLMNSRSKRAQISPPLILDTGSGI